MASTSTTTSTTFHSARRRPRAYPADYDVRVTNVTPTAPSTQATLENSLEAPSHRNPPEWPDNYRRIPVHRPVNRNLDQSQRRVYTSFAEQVFLTMMFTGLEVNVIANRIWKYTCGRVSRNVFTYQVGGEF
ncbi:hypothetical protein PHISP_02006 [Aspergillus sp. HF37]|nr:hypothetical protein PHISP_02006 [Aspergillus sp. HF37]